LYGTSAAWRETILSCCPPIHYPYVEFALALRRRPAFYVLHVIVPCVFVSVLAMVGFRLPPDAGEKVSLGMSVVLAHIVFILLLAETVPRTSLHVPVIGTPQALFKDNDLFTLSCGQKAGQHNNAM